MNAYTCRIPDRSLQPPDSYWYAPEPEPFEIETDADGYITITREGNVAVYLHRTDAEAREMAEVILEALNNHIGAE